MRQARHDKVKHQLTDLLRQKGFHCEEEKQCTDQAGSIRRVDIVAFEPNSNKAYIIDPACVNKQRCGYRSPRGQRAAVSRLFRLTQPDLRSEIWPLRDFEVIGLWMGARGTLRLINSVIIYILYAIQAEQEGAARAGRSNAGGLHPISHKNFEPICNLICATCRYFCMGHA